MFLIRVLFWVGPGRAATSVVVPASSRRRASLLLLPKLDQEGANMARSSSFAGDEGTHVSTRGGPFQYLDSLRYRLQLCFDLAIEIFSFLPFGMVVQSR
jgi:hypothetical protein